MRMSKFVGTWKLVSWENRSGGDVSYPMGSDAVGYITYTDDGFMHVTLMASGRALFSSGDLLGGSVEERAAVAGSFVAYCGRYEIGQGRVYHHIEVSSFPNWTGVTQERIFEFQDNRLFLSTDPLLLDGKQQTAHLIWERIT